jgi:hypothetical protein
MLQLNEQDLKQINDFLQDMPLKWGLPLLNYINAKIKEQSKPQEILEEVKEIQ